MPVFRVCAGSIVMCPLYSKAKIVDKHSTFNFFKTWLSFFPQVSTAFAFMHQRFLSQYSVLHISLLSLLAVSSVQLLPSLCACCWHQIYFQYTVYQAWIVVWSAASSRALSDALLVFALVENSLKLAAFLDHILAHTLISLMHSTVKLKYLCMGWYVKVFSPKALSLYNNFSHVYTITCSKKLSYCCSSCSGLHCSTQPGYILWNCTKILKVQYFYCMFIWE